MKRLILRIVVAAMLAASTSSLALEFEFGLGYSLAPMYDAANPEAYPEQTQEQLVGKLSLYHTFDIYGNLGLKVYGDHYSLLNEREPNPNSREIQGLNILGVSGVYKFF